MPPPAKPERYKHENYPKVLYKGAGKNQQTIIVKDPDDQKERAPAADGWCEHPDEAAVFGKKTTGKAAAKKADDDKKDDE